jgi:hypothetical protein
VAEQPPAAPQPPPVGSYPATRPTDSGAIAALVIGVISPIGALMFYGVTGVILGSVAVFLGLRARSRIKGVGGMVGGAGMAQAAWIIGVCAIVLGLVMTAITIGSFLYASPSGKKGV